MSETLAVERDGAIAHVTLLSPTMPPRFFDELGQTFRAFADDSEVRAVLVSSSSKHFSYGLDLPAAASELGDAFAGGGAATRMKLLRRIEILQRNIDAVAQCPVPVICAIHGWCIGGGVDLASACDIRVGSADAKLSVRETKIAIVADLGSLQRLPGIIGQGHTRELAYTGKDVTAARAKEIGLLNEVFPDRDALMAGGRALAQEIAGNAPLTVRGVKRMLDFGAGRRTADGLDYVAAWNSAFLSSEDLGEAMAAFLQKRPASFSGK